MNKINLSYLFTVFIAISAIAQAPQASKKKCTIDLTNWKVTMPYGSPDPAEIEGAAVLDFEKDPEMNKYMYVDEKDGGLVFYATPGVTTENTSYARCELREQMVVGNDHKNWTFEQGGRMKGKLKIDAISKNKKNKDDKVVIMQIHGKLTEKDRARIKKKDHDAPPIMKISWYNGEIRLVSKVLRKGKSGNDIYYKDSWTDAEPYVFPAKVGFNPFTLEIIAEKGKLSVILNDVYTKVYDSKDIKKWGVFENYFKAGTYLSSNQEDAFAKVKFYSLDVTH